MTAMIVEELARIPMSPHLAATLTRAADYAVAQAHAEVTLEHLLLSLTEDQEAANVLTSSSVDLGRLAGDVSDYLTRSELPQSEQGGPRISADLRRILEAAAAAAQQGRRREINGAIVLAAIVGDGKSAAAHILRAQGLTFEEAIKALQRVSSQPRTEDVLANARERVQSRSNSHPLQTEQPRQLDPRIARGAEPLPREPELAPPSAKPAQHVPEKPVPEPSTLPPQPIGWAPPPPQPRLPEASPTVGPAAGAPSGGSGPQSTSSPAPNSAATRIAIPRANHTPAPAAPSAQPGPPGSMFPPPIPMQPSSETIGGAPDFAPAKAAAPPPWADPAEAQRAPAPMPPRTSASMPPPAAPSVGVGPSAPARRRAPGPFPTTIPHVESGQLVENIPRTMRRGIPVVAEARIGRADLKALTEGLQGGGAAYQHDVTITKAMSVRLRAPEGGFWIEPRSPETQWIENILGISTEEYASWRWTVTPRTSGRKQLQIIVSARTVGADGMTADTALPDQIIDVKVGINYGESLRRWTGWAAAAVAGGVLARFGDGIFDLAHTVVTKIASGN